MLPRDHYLKQSFQDLARFPNGFEKGGLSDIQARLVRKYGALISALCIDEVSDATPDDLHILKVIANQSAPKSPVEQAWIKYLSIIKSIEATSTGKTKAAKTKTAKAAAEAVDEPEKPVEKADSKSTKKTKADTEEPVAKTTKTKAAAEPAKATTKKTKA